jgi:hypothetical protein
MIQSKYKIVKGVPGIAAELEMSNGVIQLTCTPANNQRVLLHLLWCEKKNKVHVGVCGEEVGCCGRIDGQVTQSSPLGKLVLARFTGSYR